MCQAGSYPRHLPHEESTPPEQHQPTNRLLPTGQTVQRGGHEALYVADDFSLELAADPYTALAKKCDKLIDILGQMRTSAFIRRSPVSQEHLEVLFNTCMLGAELHAALVQANGPATKAKSLQESTEPLVRAYTPCEAQTASETDKVWVLVSVEQWNLGNRVTVESFTSERDASDAYENHVNACRRVSVPLLMDASIRNVLSSVQLAANTACALCEGGDLPVAQAAPCKQEEA